MFKKIRFFKRFKKLVFGGFAIVCGAITCCLLGSWTKQYILPYGEVYISENQVDQSKFYNNVNAIKDTTVNGLSANQISISITQYNSTDSYVYFYDVFRPTESNFYTISISIDNQYIQGMGFVQNNTTNFTNIPIGNQNYNTDYLNANTMYGFGIEFTPNLPQITFEVNIMVVFGQNPKPYEPFGTFVTTDQYDNLSNNYNSLQQQYNDLQQQYNDLLDSASNIDKLNYKIWIAIQNTSQTSWDFTKVQQLNSADYINDLGFLDVSSIYTNYINGTNNTILVESVNVLNALNYDLMFNVNGSGNNINILTRFVNFNPVQTPLFGLTSTDNSSLTLTNFIKYQDSSVTSIVNYSYDAFAIVYTNVGNDLANIKLNGQGDYNLGYVNGLAQNNLEFQQLQSNYDTLSNNYDTLESNFENLQQQYNNLANTDLGFSMSKLMWNIAATPFESFKSIWSVNFLDFNIASFITGILSIFVIVWLLKKIF